MNKKKQIIAGQVVIMAKNSFLLVKERSAPYRGKWNFPTGKLETGETLIETAVRETKEETGYTAEITDFLRICQSLKQPGLNIILVIFRARIVSGKLNYDKTELIEAKWFSRPEFDRVPDTDLVHPEMRNTIKIAFLSPQPVEKLYTVL
ncbi:MAG: NUDIX hydrolase [bacterium]|nr:NUDIX hydrolase [bacterium]